MSAVSTGDRPSWLALVAGAPGVLLAVLIVITLLAWVMGVPPVRSGRTITLSEAAALEDEADIVRLTRSGADPNARSFVRRTLLRDVHQMMTPLEAAVTARHVSVMQLLEASGAVIDDRNAPVLWCFAEQRRNEEVLAFLRSRRSPRVAIDCSTVRIPTVRP